MRLPSKEKKLARHASYGLLRVSQDSQPQSFGPTSPAERVRLVRTAMVKALAARAALTPGTIQSILDRQLLLARLEEPTLFLG
jgi:hypothetical protein